MNTKSFTIYLILKYFLWTPCWAFQPILRAQLTKVLWLSKHSWWSHLPRSGLTCPCLWLQANHPLRFWSTLCNLVSPASWKLETDEQQDRLANICVSKCLSVLEHQGIGNLLAVLLQSCQSNLKLQAKILVFCVGNCSKHLVETSQDPVMGSLGLCQERPDIFPKHHLWAISQGHCFAGSPWSRLNFLAKLGPVKVAQHIGHRIMLFTCKFF